MASTTMVSEKYPEGRGRKSTSADLMKPTKTWVVNTKTEPQCGTLFFLSAIKLQCYPIAVQCESLVKVYISEAECYCRKADFSLFTYPNVQTSPD